MHLQMRFHRQVKTDLKIKVMKILIDNGHGEDTPGKRSQMVFSENTSMPDK